MAEETQAQRLVRYARNYSIVVWGEDVLPQEVADVERMVLRVDGWANAHVESECPCGRTPERCGEVNAAAEWVETR